MRRLLILTVALVFGLDCAGDVGPQKRGDAANQTVQQSTATPTPLAESVPNSKPVEERKDVPAEFKNIDFKNFAYPISRKHQTVSLKDGRVEYFRNKYLGDGWFELGDVDFVDLTGDGKLEAVVRLFWVSCGGSHLFYFYSLERGRLKLLSRIETGSLGNGECGLKSFVLTKTKLALETLHVCRFDGTRIKVTHDPHPNPDAKMGKFMAHKFTRFNMNFNGSRFVAAKREVLPNGDEDIMNYSWKIELSND